MDPLKLIRLKHTTQQQLVSLEQIMASAVVAQFQALLHIESGSFPQHG